MLCHVLSILFEFLEYSLTFQLPNFNECWWDHWILDALVCNAFGIYLGGKVCAYLEVKTYDWRGMYTVSTYRGKLQRAAAQFSPYYWTPYKWEDIHDLKTWGTTLLVIFLVLVVDLSAFYLKAVLWIPVESPLNMYRLFLLCFAPAVAIREIYQYAHDSRCKRFGQQAWVVILILITEILITIKYGKGQFPNDPDPVWIAFWLVLIGATALWTVSFAIVPVIKSKSKRASQIDIKQD